MELRYPEIKTRIQSVFIDTFLIIGLSFFAATIFEKVNPSQDGDDGWIRGVVFISLWLIYEPLSTTLGCTVGNYLMKIRVRKQEDKTKRINIFQSYGRFIIKLSLGWISFLTVTSDKERRALHDKFAGSVMIEK